MLFGSFRASALLLSRAAYHWAVKTMLGLHFFGMNLARKLLILTSDGLHAQAPNRATQCPVIAVTPCRSAAGTAESSLKINDLWPCLSIRMEDTSLRRTLIRIWPLLYSATYRLLDPAEVGEVRRLTRILQARLQEGTGDDGVLQRFLEQINDSGVLAGKRAASVDRLLEQLAEVRNLIN